MRLRRVHQAVTFLVACAAIYWTAIEFNMPGYQLDNTIRFVLAFSLTMACVARLIGLSEQGEQERKRR